MINTDQSATGYFSTIKKLNLEQHEEKLIGHPIHFITGYESMLAGEIDSVYEGGIIKIKLYQEFPIYSLLKMGIKMSEVIPASKA